MNTAHHRQAPKQVPDLTLPCPDAPPGMTHLLRTHWQVTLDGQETASLVEHWHATLDSAISAGLKACCINACTWVSIHAADGTVECTWRYADESGHYDNQWQDVGPAATTRRAERMAQIADQMHSAQRRAQPPH